MWRRLCHTLHFDVNECFRRPNLFPLTIFRFVVPNTGEFYQNRISFLGDVPRRWLQQFALDFAERGSHRPKGNEKR